METSGVAPGTEDESFEDVSTGDLKALVLDLRDIVIDQIRGLTAIKHKADEIITVCDFLSQKEEEVAKLRKTL